MIFVKHKLFWTGPYICTVCCNINWNITDYFNSIVISIFFEIIPLGVEKILKNFIVLYSFRAFFCPFVYCRFFIIYEFFFPFFRRCCVAKKDASVLSVAMLERLLIFTFSAALLINTHGTLIFSISAGYLSGLPPRKTKPIGFCSK